MQNPSSSPGPGTSICAITTSRHDSATNTSLRADWQVATCIPLHTVGVVCQKLETPCRQVSATLNLFLETRSIRSIDVEFRWVEIFAVDVKVVVQDLVPHPANVGGDGRKAGSGGRVHVPVSDTPSVQLSWIGAEGAEIRTAPRAALCTGVTVIATAGQAGVRRPWLKLMCIDQWRGCRRGLLASVNYGTCHDDMDNIRSSLQSPVQGVRRSASPLTDTGQID